MNNKQTIFIIITAFTNEKIIMRLIILAAFILSMTNLSAQKEWEIRSPMPSGAEGRHHPATFSIGEYGYVMTGGGNSGELKDAYKYHGPTDTWTQIEDFPGLARSFAYATQTSGKGYLGFGIGREQNGPVVYLNDLWEFDAETETWKELASCPCRGRSHPAFVATSDKIFVGLGNDNMGNMKDWWEYDIATDTWSSKPEYPGARRHHPYFFEIEGLVYVAFGHGDIIYNDLYVYDPATEEWEFLGFLPDQGRVAGTEFSYGGKGYVLSGDNDEHDHLPRGEMYSYDPMTNEWTKEQPHPGPGRWAPGSFVIDGVVYFTGGDNLILYNDLISYDLKEETSTAEEVIANELSIFPNPSDGIVTIQGLNSQVQYRVYDSKGTEVKQGQTTNYQIDLRNYPDGSYFLELDRESASQTLQLNLSK